MKILVIEDDRVARTIITSFLNELGHTVTAVETADEGWSLYEQEAFRIILTDWRMPGMSGLEFCRRVREFSDKRGYTYLIMLTSNANQIAGLSAGADDFITKPFDPDELRFRMNTGLRVLDLEDRLQHQADLASESREELNVIHQRLRSELNAASELQRSLLPTGLAEEKSIDYSWFYEPSADLGGDYFNVMKLAPDRFGVLMTDVCGHGVKPALLAVTMHYIMDTKLRQCPLLWGDTDVSPQARVVPPVEVLNRMNRQFPADNTVSQYFTMLYGVMEADTGCFRYSTAGHPPPIHVPLGAEGYQLPGCGVPVGLHDEPDFDTESVVLSPGDRLLFLSDGVMESKKHDGAMIGIEQVIQWAEEGRALNTSDLSEMISQNLSGIRKAEGPEDDVSILVVEYNGKAVENTKRTLESQEAAVMIRM